MSDSDVRDRLDRRKLLLWVQALESGEYKQGHSVLHRVVGGDSGEGQMCCLGVLCRVAIADGLSLTVVMEDRPWGDSVYGFGDTPEFAYLPPEVIDWLLVEGVEPADADMNPVIGTSGGGSFVRATAANDSLQLNFERIAGNLRAYYKLGAREPQSADGVGPA